MRRRAGFTFASFISFMGTLAIGLAILQADASMTALRRSTAAAARARARAAGASLAASLGPSDSGSLELPGVSAHAEPGVVRVQVTVRGQPLEVRLPR